MFHIFTLKYNYSKFYSYELKDRYLQRKLKQLRRLFKEEHLLTFNVYCINKCCLLYQFV